MELVIDEVLKFRDLFGKVVAAGGFSRHQYAVASFSRQDIFYRLEGVFRQQGGWHDAFLHIRDSGRLCHAAIVGVFRNDRPAPDMRDLLLLGIVLGNRRLGYTIPDKTPRSWDVEIVDFVRIDSDGGWRSVLELGHLKEKLWCPYCDRFVWNTWADMREPEPHFYDDEWARFAKEHGEHCPWVLSRGDVGKSDLSQGRKPTISVGDLNS